MVTKFLGNTVCVAICVFQIFWEAYCISWAMENTIFFLLQGTTANKLETFYSVMNVRKNKSALAKISFFFFAKHSVACWAKSTLLPRAAQWLRSCQQSLYGFEQMNFSVFLFLCGVTHSLRWHLCASSSCPSSSSSVGSLRMLITLGAGLGVSPMMTATSRCC